MASSSSSCLVDDMTLTFDTLVDLLDLLELIHFEANVFPSTAASQVTNYKFQIKYQDESTWHLLKSSSDDTLD